MKIINLGLIDYNSALAIQNKDLDDVINGAENRLIFCQHHDCLVTGRRSNLSNIKTDKLLLTQKGIPVFNSPRGGNVTAHNPGQLICYPIINLASLRPDLRWYFSTLENSVSATLDTLGIRAELDERRRGVWIDGRKICSIGIAVKKWVTYFGLAVNVNNDLSIFSHILPCGEEITMTSIQQETGKTTQLDALALLLADNLSAALNKPLKTTKTETNL